MSIVRWDPLRELDDMRRVFNGLQRDHSNEARADWSPAVDISETQEAFTVHAEIPAMQKEDIKISVDDGVLTLTGERKSEREEKNKKFHRVERSYGRFQRSFSLPTTVDTTKAVASYDNGVLNVMLPKLALPSKTKEIKII